MRLGIFGGSFDPVHNGHLELARSCQSQAALDEVWFVPTARQPLKMSGPRASADDRCGMLERAIAGEPGWKLCRLEIDRGGTSYTIDTLRSIHAEHPEAELFLLMGGDALADLPSWLEPEEICRLAIPLVVGRAGDAMFPLLPDGDSSKIHWQAVEMAEIPASSREIRRRVAADQSIAEFTPPAVAQYIAEQGLYRNGAD